MSPRSAARSPDPLAEDPFTVRVTKDGKAMIARGDRTIAVVAGRAATRLLARLQGADPAAAQQILARVTGNYRRGNER